MTTVANSIDRTHAVFGAANRRPPPRAARTARFSMGANGEILRTADGSELMLRAIRPDDFAALQRGFRNLSPEEVRMRFLHPLTDLVEPVARTLCEVEPPYGVALVLIDPPSVREPEIHAVVRAYIDPTTLAAEFAIVVQRRFTGKGLGTLLMHRLIDTCRERGAVELWGDVFLDNGAMLALCDRLGFERHSQLYDPGIVRVRLDLTKPAIG
ncbi:MAG TPA: GNAT family N-acetyltransferase [Rudaea sp.]